MKCPHCDMSIDEHEAGRETDVCVAEAVMGYKKRVFAGQDPESLWDDAAIFDIMEDTGMTHTDGNGHAIASPLFSTSIAAAWEVVEQLANDNWIISIGWGNGRDGRKYASIQMSVDLFLEADLFNRPSTQMDAKALSAPLAICRAALKAVHETQTA